jgi:cell fate regulator YaaT (PSP1 superfamily)
MPDHEKERPKMPLVVGVAFRPVTKVYYFDPAGHDDLAAGENVVVETSRGRTLGQVVLAPRAVPESEISGTLKPVIRRASAWDMVQHDQMVHREPEALSICRERAAALAMDIKVINVEFSFDGSSAVVYFTSEQRVDFRNLVHDLSQALRTRVEMRQVGVRDEAKFLGGYGRCGRELCCATWLREFAPVSIKMAKTQDLPLNAPEVSGVCGRLLCCLAYENDFYSEARKQMPRINSVVETPQGPGKVRQVHVLANSIRVMVEGPNDTRQWVDMPVPEPVFDLRMKPANEARGLFSEPSASGDPATEKEDAGEGAAEVAGPTLPAQDGSPRKARPRRKKR